VAFHRRIDEPEPADRPAGAYEVRRARSSRLATGTLACPLCDAPVALAGGAVTPASELGCPFCGHAGAARDFLSLAAPVRPARVVVRAVLRARR
jgi:hypothetical protein